jgi:HEAT repeat protein
VRTAAAKALGVLGGTTAPRVLVAAAHDREARVRREAVSALGHFDEPASIETLVDLAGDRDREVALRAAESLLALRSGLLAGAGARTAVASASTWSVEYGLTISELGAA